MGQKQERVQKKSTGQVMRVMYFVVVPLLVGLFAYAALYAIFLKPVDEYNFEQQLVELNARDTFESYARKLEKKGLVKSWWILEIIGRLRGKGFELKQGEYAFSKMMTPVEIFNRIKNGELVFKEFAFYAGVTAAVLARKLAAHQLGLAEDFLKSLRSSKLLAKAGLQAESFEGYLAPGAYHVTKSNSFDGLVWTMFLRQEQQWLKLVRHKGNTTGLSRHEILTLASIIQKEVTYVAQYKDFSALLHNRLANGQKLESQAALLRGLNIHKNPDNSFYWRGELSEKDYSFNSPYNTFMYKGLPPAPICNPSLEAIMAALYPGQKPFKNYQLAAEGAL